MNTLIDLYRTDRALMFRYPRLNLATNCLLIPVVCVGFLVLGFIAAHEIYSFLLASDRTFTALRDTALIVSLSVSLQIVCIYTARYILNPTFQNLKLVVKAWLAVVWRMIKKFLK
jgi:hypothetical protein